METKNPTTLLELIDGIPQGGRLLDAGCGSGKTVHFITKHRPDIKISAVDILDESYRLPPSVHFQVAPVEDIAKLFNENEFDAIISQHVIEHLLLPMAFMENCKKVLKPDHPLYIETPSWIRTLLPFHPRLWFWSDYTHVRPYSRETMRRLCRDFKFKIHAMHSFPSTRLSAVRSIGGLLSTPIRDMFYVIAINQK